MKATSANKSFLKILNIREGEGYPIFLLLVYSFFMGLAIAFFYTSATSLFLNEFQSSILPYAYIGGGVLSYFLWFLYSRLEQKIKYSGLLVVGISVLLFSVIAIVISYALTMNKWLTFVMFIWIRFFLFITVVGFWGLATRLFNIRQGKRLFGLISSGEVISNIIGFFCIPLLLKFINTFHLLYFAIFALILCLLVMLYIIKAFRMKLSIMVVDNISDSSETGLSVFFKKKYFFLIFLLAILPMFGICFADFLFLDQTKIEFSDPEVMSSFLGIFFGFMAIGEFLIKTFASGRIISKYGLKLGLILLPIVLLGVNFFASVFGTIYGTASIFFSFIALSKLLEKIFRSGIFEPSFQILYQPIPAAQRLALQSKTEGIPRSLGNVLAGASLLLFTNLKMISLVHVAWIFIIILGFWTKISIDMYKEYRKSLKDVLDKTDSNKQFSKEKLNFSYQFKKLIYKRIFSPNLLKYHLLYSIDPYVLNSVIKQNSITIDEDYIRSTKELLLFDNYNNIDNVSLKVDKGLFEQSINFIEKYNKLSIEEIEQLAKSENIENRLIAASLAGYSKSFKINQVLLELLQDKNLHVKRAAIVSAGHLKRYEFWQSLFEVFNNRLLLNSVSSAFKNIGAPSLKELDQFFVNRAGKDAQLRIIKIYEQIGSKSSINLIKDKIDFPDKDIAYQVLLSLSSLGYQARMSEKTKIKFIIEERLNTLLWLASVMIDLKETPNIGELKTELEFEMKKKREDIFLLLSLIYDSKTIMLARENFDNGGSEERIFALEIIDMLLSDDLKEMLLPVFDDISLEDFLNSYKMTYFRYRCTDLERIFEIINADNFKISIWTKTLAIDSLKYFDIEKTRRILKANIIHPELIIREIAVHILNEFDKEALIEFTNHASNTNKKLLSPLLNNIDSIQNTTSLSSIKKVRLLRNAKLFKNLPNSILASLISNSYVHTIGSGKKFIYNTNTHYYYYLAKGKFSSGSNTYKESDCIGHIVNKSYIKENTEYIAEEDSILLVLNNEKLINLINLDESLLTIIMDNS